MPPETLELLPAAGRPEQWMVLLHGRGQDAASMLPLAHALRQAFPQAALLMPQGFDPYDGDGEPDPARRQWMAGSARDDAGLADRAAAALPRLARWVQDAQQRLGASPQATALAGFSQGALMALELASAHDGLAGRVLAFGGRYASLPARAPQLTTLHFFHGGADAVHPAAHARRALEHLSVLHGDATLDVAEGVGHELHAALIDCALYRLTHHIPHRTWRAALGALPASARTDRFDAD
jgi:phospholipase/carboxylesterase